MNHHVYKKNKKKDKMKIGRFLGLSMFVGGLVVWLYIFFPLISWQLYLEPAFASSSYASPIPKSTILTKNYLKSLFNNTANALTGVNYDNASNWLPPKYNEAQSSGSTLSYSISIPKLNIENAAVSTTDTDLNSHLVHFPGTSVPPARGTAAVFGHSTLPQLYDKKNYKTIFANIHELSVGDTLIVNADNTLLHLKYKEWRIKILKKLHI